MVGDGQQVDPEALDRDGDLADRMGGIGVDDGTGVARRRYVLGGRARPSGWSLEGLP